MDQEIKEKLMLEEMIGTFVPALQRKVRTMKVETLKWTAVQNPRLTWLTYRNHPQLSQHMVSTVKSGELKLNIFLNSFEQKSH